MIDNSDTIGHYAVRITARRNSVAGFQCPTLDDVREEIGRIARERGAQGLPIGTITVRQIIARRPMRFGPPIEVPANT